MKHLAIVFSILLLATIAAAQTLQGTVTNATLGKPGAGDEVTLISLGNGMNEVAHTKSDSNGRFTFTLSGDPGMPHLVRVSHQEVNYFRMVPPGVTSAEVQIYEVARKVEGISTAVQVMRLQSEFNALQVIELYAVQNTAQPPRTLGGERTFEIALPEGAKVDSASARAPNGQPVRTMPIEVEGKKGRYALSFPLRPGETQFEIAYQLPYSGQATIRPLLLRDAQHFVAVLPSTMQFAPIGNTQFSAMPDDSGANVQVVTNAKAGSEIAFTVSGTGVLRDEPQGGQESAQGGAMGGGPGGGIGKPIDTPDPLSKYRWPLLGIFAAAFAIGGVYVAKRRPSEQVDVTEAPDAADNDESAPAVPRSRSSLLLEAMKEELFQLEVERQQGKISQEEYIAAKAALDQTLKRALARAGE